MVKILLLLLVMSFGLVLINMYNKPLESERLKTYKLVTYPAMAVTILYLTLRMGYNLETLNIGDTLAYYAVLVLVNVLLGLFAKYYEREAGTLLKIVGLSTGAFLAIILTYSFYLEAKGIVVQSSGSEVVNVGDVPVKEAEAKIAEIESLIQHGDFTQYCTNKEDSKFVPSCYPTYTEYLEKQYSSVNEGVFLKELNYRQQELAFINQELDEIEGKIHLLKELKSNLTNDLTEAHTKVSSDIDTLTESYNQLVANYNKANKKVEVYQDLSVHNFNYMKALGWVAKGEKFEPLQEPIAEFENIEALKYDKYLTAYIAALPLNEQALIWTQERITDIQKNGFKLPEMESAGESTGDTADVTVEDMELQETTDDKK